MVGLARAPAAAGETAGTAVPGETGVLPLREGRPVAMAEKEGTAPGTAARRGTVATEGPEAVQGSRPPEHGEGPAETDPTAKTEHPEPVGTAAMEGPEDTGEACREGRAGPGSRARRVEEDREGVARGPDARRAAPAGSSW